MPLIVASRSLPSGSGRTGKKEQPIKLPGFGPGTELMALLKSIGVTEKPNCPCKQHAARMDLWGVKLCREHRETIIGWLRAGQDQWGWSEKLAIAAKAVSNGVAFKLNPLDPLQGLVDEAIRRAEAKG